MNNENEIVARIALFSLDDGTDALNSLLNDAIKEIERLQADGNRWLSLADDFYYACEFDDEEAIKNAMKKWEMAAEGE